MSDPPKTLRDERYAIVRVLGEGGQATTFEGVDKKNGRLVAIKRFLVRGAKSWKEVELAEREATVLASISHPAIPRHVEHFEENGELYLVTEKIEGESLAALKARGGRLQEAEIVRFLREAGAALDYLHGCAPPIVHRDLKPSNVIRRPDGSFAFIDFGSVRDRMKPQGGSTVVGTFGYMAPEQFQGRAMPSSDVYAVGATALAMLTGCDPEDLPHKGLAIDVSSALRGARVNRTLTRALAAMLEPDPDRRPQRIGPLLGEAPRGSGKSRGSAAPSSFGAAPFEDMPRRDRRRAEREQWRAQREQWREERRRRRGRGEGAGRLPPLLLFIVLLGLTAAQVAVILALRVAVPIALSLLSIAFGKGLREAAQHVTESGKLAGESIERAKQHLRYAAVPAAPFAGGPRVAVDEERGPVTQVRFEGGDAAARDEAAEEEAAEAEARERGKRSR